MPIATTNPATGQTLRTFAPISSEQVEAAISRSSHACRQLRDMTVEERGDWLNMAAALLEAERDDVARLITTEMGKTYAAAQAEVAGCVNACRFYVTKAPAFLADEPADAASVGAARAFVRYQPLGPILAVMPWNFPLWQVFRFAAPALMAGNTGLLKHASNVPQTALYLADLFRRAGFPPGAFSTLLVGSDAVEAILRDPRVRAATVTGSERTGRTIAQIAGRELKKTVLELGGSDPFVVMPSADLDRAAEVATASRCRNNGQSCIAAKRFIVHTDVFDAFAERFAARMSALRVGDPMEEATDVGPLVSEGSRAEIAAQVRDAVDQGATLRCGGELPAGEGWYYPPTVVADLTPRMRMWAEEVFGPVAGLYRVSSYDEAIEVANGTAFGLGANAWTEDPAEQERFVIDLEAGNVFVNGMTTSFPELPFGGVKNSGYGRELAAVGMREFCNTKTVWVGGDGRTESVAAYVE
ncbi:NADP-dependent succinic semialdehyde dehydrogenase [Salinispora fenicalii]|uniref:NADP-dependent succinic semialdehyde dehydrogenase n=1 Tax=Salinispora fenicalii TaxID=1137263 RepID=UPI0004853BE0|nr:NADP-dependent succinic semialdehyde dehydrogenase [Salinispora fenicalii]